MTEDFCFCPHCGKGAGLAIKCPECGTAVCRQCGQAYRFCPGCGVELVRASAT